MNLQSQTGEVRDFWAMPDPTDPALAWLGQAGFAIRWNKLRLLIDPYLSDVLEKKYRGTERPHDRMMAAPIKAGELHDLDYVLCTHRHSDHMDPETLPTLASAHPACRFVVPRAELEAVTALGLSRDILIPIDAGERILVEGGAWLEAIPAAHETLEIDGDGHHRFLGYLLSLGAQTIYHSGDSVLYPGLKEFLLSRDIDLALLPVNGAGKGVAGNLTFEEAVDLCRAAAISNLVPHHFGMFAFNTIDRSELEEKAAATPNPRCFLPDTHHWIHFNNLQGT